MKYLLILLTSILLFSNCANPPKKNNVPKEEAPVVKEEKPAPVSTGDRSLTGTYWKLTELNGKKVTDYPAQNKEPYIRLNAEDNSVAATGGCNGMGGTFQSPGENQISFSKMMSTKMACPDMTLEADFQKAIESVKLYMIHENEMILKTTAGTDIKFVEGTPK